MSLVPIALRPRVIMIRNRWRSSSGNGSRARDLLMLLIGLVIMLSIYVGTFYTLRVMKNIQHTIYAPPSQIISLVLIFLFISLIVTNLATTIGALFLSKDLDLLQSSPISIVEFLKGKLTYVFISCSWMPFIFLLPVILGFGVFYDAGLNYYALAPLISVIFFAIPSAISVVIALLLTSIVPANKTRFIVFVLCCAAIYAIYAVVDVVIPSDGSSASISEIVRVLSILSLPDLWWVPSNWASQSIEYLLIGGQQRIVMIEIGMLLSTAIMFGALGYLVTRFTYDLAYSRSQMYPPAKRIWSDSLHKLFAPIALGFNHRARALITKEIRFLSRDMAQAVQVLLLIGIAALYLYNLKIFRVVDSSSFETQKQWTILLHVTNISMGAFLSTAICTRFVFPSISLEGRAHWMIQSGPITIDEFMRIKFWTWFPLVGVMSCSIFAIGAFAIGSSIPVIFINATAAWCIAYGVVGLAIGFGSVFADFNWEHPSQLAASFGSLSYMIFSITLIAFSMIPVALMVLAQNPMIRTFKMGYNQNIALVMLGFFCLLGINIVVKRIAFRHGHRALEAKRT